MISPKKLTETGGPAFPFDTGTCGMTLRDYFAAQAMQGILVGMVTPTEGWSHNKFAEIAYNVADAMLKAREE